MKKVILLIMCVISFICLSATERTLVRFQNPDQAFLNKLKSEHFDIALYIQDKFVDVVIDHTQLTELIALNSNYKIVQTEAEMKNNLSSGTKDIPGYRSYTQIVEALTDASVLHSDICQLQDLGQSMGAQYNQQGFSNYANFNHNLYAVKLSDNPSVEEDEPSYYIFGVHHAREPLGAEVSLYVLNYLLNAYNTDPEITALINNSQIWFVPLVNPNGHKVVLDQTDVWWRKNIRDNNEDHQFNTLNQWGYGADGVDLNRNYGMGWGYFSSTDEFEYPTYHGTMPFSEPETMIIKNLVDNHPFVAGISYHTYGGLVLYPWGGLPDVYAPDYLVLRDLAEKMAATIQKTDGTSSTYIPEAGWTLYPASGGLDEYSYDKNGTLAYTIEMAEEFIPSAEIVTQTGVNNLTAAKMMLKRASKSCVTGLIKDTQNNPLQAEVYIEGIDNFGYPRAKYKSNPQFGRYYRCLMPGVYEMRFHKWGYESVIQTITIDTTQQTVQNITMNASQPCQLRVLVLGEFELPVNGVKVSFPDSELEDIYTDNQGLAYFPNHYTGLQRIVVDKVGSDKINKYITLHEGINNLTFNLAAPIILDSFDDGPLNWIKTGAWGVTNSQSVTGPKSLADSPNGTYNGETDITCKYPSAISLTDCSQAVLSFMTKYSMTLDADYVSVEISADGQNWSTLDVFVENQDTWVEKYYSLNQYLNQNVYIRFHLVTTSSTPADGIYIDDFRVIKNNNPVAQDDNTLETINLIALGNYPNPFNPNTKISFLLNKADEVSCDIFNIKGQKVKSFKQSFAKAGTHEFNWNGKDLNNKNVASGVYFYTLSNKEKRVSKKMILIK